MRCICWMWQISCLVHLQAFDKISFLSDRQNTEKNIQSKYHIFTIKITQIPWPGYFCGSHKAHNIQTCFSGCVKPQLDLVSAWQTWISPTASKSAPIKVGSFVHTHSIDWLQKSERRGWTFLVGREGSRMKRMVSRSFTRWRGRDESQEGGRRKKVEKNTVKEMKGKKLPFDKKEKKKKEEGKIGEVAVFSFLFSFFLFLWGGTVVSRRRRTWGRSASGKRAWNFWRICFENGRGFLLFWQGINGKPWLGNFALIVSNQNTFTALAIIQKNQNYDLTFYNVHICYVSKTQHF